MNLKSDSNSAVTRCYDRMVKVARKYGLKRHLVLLWMVIVYIYYYKQWVPYVSDKISKLIQFMTDYAKLQEYISRFTH